MKWLTNNFSLNMINVKGNYTLVVCHLTELQFKVEIKTAENCLSQMDVGQELGLFPRKRTVAAEINDTIYVAQPLDGELTFRKITVGDIQ
jgi:hypothetical protein